MCVNEAARGLNIVDAQDGRAALDCSGERGERGLKSFINIEAQELAKKRLS